MILKRGVGRVKGSVTLKGHSRTLAQTRLAYSLLMDWPSSLLHDAVLVSAELGWNTGTLRLEFVPHQVYDQPRVIEVHEVSHAEFPRRHECGPSVSVLEAKEPEPSNGGYRLVITMQSGDDLVVVGKEFVLDP